MDHRPYTIPLTILGFLLLAVGVLAGILPTDDLTNPWGLAGGGLALVGIALAIAALAEGTLIAISVVGAAALVALVLVVGIVAGASFSPIPRSDAAPAGTNAPGGAGSIAAADGPLGSETFSGSVQGAALPAAIPVPADSSASSEVEVPAGATQARIEIVWTSSPTTTDTFDLTVTDSDGNELGSTSGGSPLTLDIDLEGTTSIQVTVALPPGSASGQQAFDGYASFFEGAIPAGFTAVEE